MWGQSCDLIQAGWPVLDFFQRQGIIFPPPRPDGPWGTTTRLSDWYRETVQRGYSGRRVKPTNHFHFEMRFRKSWVLQVSLLSVWNAMAWFFVLVSETILPLHFNIQRVVDFARCSRVVYIVRKSLLRPDMVTESRKAVSTTRLH
jgi:hypothetical protein